MTCKLQEHRQSLWDAAKSFKTPFTVQELCRAANLNFAKEGQVGRQFVEELLLAGSVRCLNLDRKKNRTYVVLDDTPKVQKVDQPKKAERPKKERKVIEFQHLDGPFKLTPEHKSWIDTNVMHDPEGAQGPEDAQGYRYGLSLRHGEPISWSLRSIAYAFVQNFEDLRKYRDPHTIPKSVDTNDEVCVANINRLLNAIYYRHWKIEKAISNYVAENKKEVRAG